MNYPFKFLALLLVPLGLGVSVPLAHSAETMDLAGKWNLTLDPGNLGVAAGWFRSNLTAAAVDLPGSVQAAGRGEPISVQTKWTGGIFDQSFFTAPTYAPYRQANNLKVPFWLQPETHYTGAAWYQRRMELPREWAGRRVVLLLERPHWKTTAWVDDRELGSNDSLSTAHRYDLGSALAPGWHRLTLRVDNTLDPDIGENSHSVSDHTQGNWNGIVGRIELEATALTWVDDLQVYPGVSEAVLRVRGRVGREAGVAVPRAVTLESDAAARPGFSPVQADGTFEANLPMVAGAALWDEFNPRLHHLAARLENGEGADVVFGLRDFRAAGRQFLVNGRPTFLRGTLDCAAYPRTGSPPMDLASWRRVFSTIKAYGLNHVRFHSWCPPEAAFAAADQLGIYCQVEVASWPNWSTTLGDGKPVDGWLDRESARILAAYGNHPSFVMLAAGNEPGGEHYSGWLAVWVARQKAADPRRLYTSASGWPELAVNDYDITPEPRIQHWKEGLQSRINARPPETDYSYADFVSARPVPVVSHEIGQWCVYPDFGEMKEYTGYLKPRNFEIFKASLEAHGLGSQARDFLRASGRLQVLCYKEEIESALRTPAMGGFQLLGLSDFPGQGTALVGVLNAFWEPKSYVTAAEFSRFCGPTVPLARLRERIFTTDEHLEAAIQVAHSGPAPIVGALTTWQLRGDDGRSAAAGSLGAQTLAVGGPNAVGRIDLPLAAVPAPARYKLVVTVAGRAPGQRFENDWDVWVYPAARRPEGPAPVTIAHTLTAAVRRQLAAGAPVVLAIAPAEVAPDPVRGRIALGFSSIFWNTAWTNGQAPHTLGILCDPRHPALALFPTEPWSNWQWWYPVTHAAPMILDRLPSAVHPIVQVVDDWFTNRKLALVFEARVGTGRILVTSVDLGDAPLDPVRRQFRQSLLAYASSAAFRPSVSVSYADLEQLFAPSAPQAR